MLSFHHPRHLAREQKIHAVWGSWPSSAARALLNRPRVRERPRGSLVRSWRKSSATPGFDWGSVFNFAEEIHHFIMLQGDVWWVSSHVPNLFQFAEHKNYTSTFWKTWSGKGENRTSKERESRSVPTFPAWNSGDLLVPVISCGSCLTSSLARQLNQGSRHRGALGRVWCAFATCGLSLWWRSFLWCCVCFFGKGLVSWVLPIKNSPLGELLTYIESVICSSKSWGSQPLWRARRPFQRTSRCGVLRWCLMEVPENSWSLQTGLWFFTSI